MYFLFNWFVKITGWIVQVFAFRKKVYYEDRKIQGRHIKGKAVVISNHHKVIDFALMMYLFPTRTLRCQVAELMFEKNFFMKIFLKLLGAIKVDRTAHDFSFVGKSLDVLNKNGVVEIFPEARIPRKDETKPIDFKVSAAYTALHANAPVIPVYTDGNYFSKKRCHVIIGKPIDLNEWVDPKLSEKENLDIITKKLREKVIWLNDEMQRQQEKKKI